MLMIEKYSSRLPSTIDLLRRMGVRLLEIHSVSSAGENWAANDDDRIWKEKYNSWRRIPVVLI